MVPNTTPTSYAVSLIAEAAPALAGGAAANTRSVDTEAIAPTPTLSRANATTNVMKPPPATATRRNAAPAKPSSTGTNR
ncbi:hypothetical protein D3C81_1817220 [compost metagenome]